MADISMTLHFVVIIIICTNAIAYCRPCSSKKTAEMLVQGIDEKLDSGKPLNVSNKRHLRLFSPKSNNYLQVKDKVVNAKGDRKSVYIDLIIESVGFNLVRIKGEYTNNYVCFDQKSSKVKSRKNGDDSSCIFYENVGESTGRTVYTSYKKNCWSIAIKNNGKTRLGKVTVDKTRKNNTFEFISKFRS